MKIKTKEELIKWFASSLYTYRCIHINEFLDSCTKNENGDICVSQEQRATLYEEYDDLSSSVKDTFRLISEIYINGTAHLIGYLTGSAVVACIFKR